MRTRVTWWVLAVCTALLTAPATGSIGDQARARPQSPDSQGDASSEYAHPGDASGVRGDGSRTPATSAPGSPGGPGGSADGTDPTAPDRDIGDRCNPYCSDPSMVTPPPPASTYDPFAGCPHRWQIDPPTGQLVDTGCASEPTEPVTVETVPPTTMPPPVINPPTTAPPPPTPPTTAPPPTTPTTLP